MATWLVSGLLLIAAAGTGVLASSHVTFVENLHDTRAVGRIVSGWEAEPGQFPHQISLRMVNSVGGVSSCGGSIISSQWGITAAHCPGGRVSLVIRAGLVNLTTPLFIFETTKYYNHPLYNEASPFVQPNDIGLIDFGISLPFGEFVKPLRLHNSASKNRNYGGDILIASGWGRTWTNGASPENLNWVFLRGETNQLCRSFYGAIVEDSTICTSYYNVTSQSTCQGDSGGPLTTVDDDGVLSMIGIASFVSSAGCHAGFPAGFIRPGHYHSWFQEVTNINFDWDYELPTTLDQGTEPSVSPSDAPETTFSIPPGTVPSGSPSDAPETTFSVPHGTEPTVSPSDAPETTFSIPPGTVPSGSPSDAPETTFSVPHGTEPTVSPSDAPETTFSVPPGTEPSGSPSDAPETTFSVTP